MNTRFSGRMKFVYFHALWFGAWMLLNTGLFGIEPFDPFPFGTGQTGHRERNRPGIARTRRGRSPGRCPERNQAGPGEDWWPQKAEVGNAPLTGLAVPE
ncbi:MAG: DUF1003 domain-containing protein [bacterium]|nr:DUF1003 domain-containing protein [bacterium]